MAKYFSKIFFHYVANKRRGELRGNSDCESITSLTLIWFLS